VKLLARNRKTGIEEIVNFDDVKKQIGEYYKDPDVVKNMHVFHTKAFTYKWTK
jgi:hypothetical protein